MNGDLDWLPVQPDWAERLAHARSLAASEALPVYRTLAAARIDYACTLKLDRAIQAHLTRPATPTRCPPSLTLVRLALLGSSTLAHLAAAIRVAGLRRGLWIEIYDAPFGTYRQELANPASDLHRFQPGVVLFSFDARHAVELERAGGSGGAIATMRECWQQATEAFSCAVVQQTLLPVFPPLLGSQEHRLPNSPAAIVDRTNNCLRESSAAAGVQLVALDAFARVAGLTSWHDPGLWYRAKQEVHPTFAPLYGDHVARVLAALLGQTAKCLVLDLDHTLWGGGIGDDGLEGIVLGEGSAAGEAHLEVQRYALALKERGIILAVCSKNDEANALAPFEQHPEMLLRRSDIACFVADWNDKATNLRRIADELNLGLDALVFLDDNPVERGLVRRELPEVHVPEIATDPADYVPTLAAAGYFEGLGVTAEDRQRAASYKALSAARRLRGSAPGSTDLDGYLASLHMELLSSPFDAAGRARIAQLINKTNQFNLTTRRIAEPAIAPIASHPEVLTVQLRLRDVYGDHGIIAAVIAEPAQLLPGGTCICQRGGPLPPGTPDHLAAPASYGRGGSAGVLPHTVSRDLIITDWVMSCRVLSRQVEDATLNLLAQRALDVGVDCLIGRYIPTPKNSMVRDLYRRLGFTAVRFDADGTSLWSLDLQSFQPRPTHVACLEAGAVPAAR